MWELEISRLAQMVKIKDTLMPIIVELLCDSYRAIYLPALDILLYSGVEK